MTPESNPSSIPKLAETYSPATRKIVDNAIEKGIIPRTFSSVEQFLDTLPYISSIILSGDEADSAYRYFFTDNESLNIK